VVIPKHVRIFSVEYSTHRGNNIFLCLPYFENLLTYTPGHIPSPEKMLHIKMWQQHYCKSEVRSMLFMKNCLLGYNGLKLVQFQRATRRYIPKIEFSSRIFMEIVYFPKDKSFIVSKRSNQVSSRFCTYFWTLIFDSLIQIPWHVDRYWNLEETMNLSLSSE
jgi:hypothetical protein